MSYAAQDCAGEETQLEACKRLSKSLISGQIHLKTLKKDEKTALMSNPTWIPLEFCIALTPTKKCHDTIKYHDSARDVEKKYARKLLMVAHFESSNTTDYGIKHSKRLLENMSE